MLWLDSSYPPEKAGTPGGDRGDCPQDSGVPSDVEAEHASVSYTVHKKKKKNLNAALRQHTKTLLKATVIYSNIRFGPIGSTVSV